MLRMKDDIKRKEKEIELVSHSYSKIVIALKEKTTSSFSNLLFKKVNLSGI